MRADMMNNRVEEIKKRIAARRKKNGLDSNHSKHHAELPLGNDHLNDGALNDETPVGELPLGYGFSLRFFLASVLVVVVAVSQYSSIQALEPVRQLVERASNKELQFARIANHTENLYHFLPFNFSKNVEEKGSAIPANTQVMENYQVHGDGLLVETLAYKEIPAFHGGVVIFAGEKSEHGLTVVVQQTDGLHVWYGQLEEANVRLYEHIEKGDVLGRASLAADRQIGMYYLAVEKDSEFLDPITVMALE